MRADEVKCSAASQEVESIGAKKSESDCASGSLVVQIDAM